MLSFEAALSSALVLSALAILASASSQPQNPFLPFYDFMQVSDYAAAMDGAPCDFSKIPTDQNFCYSCSLYPSNTSGATTHCLSAPPGQTTTARLPVYSNGRLQIMGVSKSRH